MASKTVICSYCGKQIAVAQLGPIIECKACKTTIWIKSKDPIYQAASKIKDLLNSASSNIHMISASVNSYNKPGQSSYEYFTQMPRPLKLLVPVSAHGQKRALLCGVSYNGQKYRLNGTVNDVKCMQYFLSQKHGFPVDCMLVLTEESSDLSRIPTKRNIRKGLQWLVHGCKEGDSLIFFYSGHGSQHPNYNRDEVDGYDEMIWPVDHLTEGTIIDDEINATIVRPLPRGAKLHSIIDSCHSGTILDLPFVCRMNRDGYYSWEDHGRQSRIYQGTNGGLAISLSACDDHQVSVDTTALTRNTATGVLTYSFIEAVQNEPGLSYGHLINAMRHKIRHTNTAGIALNGPVASVVRKILFPRSPQEPQLSSSEKFDVHATQFVL